MANETLTPLIDPNGTTHLATPLCELAKHYGSDKGGWHLKAGDTVHNYTPAYHNLLADRRMWPVHVLEIGIGNGASLRMWRDYFPKSRIFGIDNDKSRLIEEERISSLYVDQGDINSLKQVFDHLAEEWGEPGPFDLIIDDGSHVTEHQILSANYLGKLLTNDGLYVIEDIYQDCHPESVLDHITWGHWEAVPVGVGLGRAHCECGCGDDVGEVLLVGTNNA